MSVWSMGLAGRGCGLSHQPSIFFKGLRSTITGMAEDGNVVAWAEIKKDIPQAMQAAGYSFSISTGIAEHLM